MSLAELTFIAYFCKTNNFLNKKSALSCYFKCFNVKNT